MNNVKKVCQNAWHTFLSKILIFIWSLLQILSISCTTELPFEPDYKDKQIVMNSIFSPGEPFNISFSITGFPTSGDHEINDIIQFSLFENEILLIDTTFVTGALSTSIFPKPKAYYSIVASSDNYMTITASDTIVRLVNIDMANIIIPAGVDEYGQEFAEARISFSDPINEKNYYELLVYSVVNGEPKSYWRPNGDTKIIDPVLINEGDDIYLPSSYFFSDELFDGQTYQMRIQSSGGGFGPKNGVTLRSVSRSYYLYRKYYTRHLYNQQLQGDYVDLIFMGEPQNMYTNICNGYGIFVGFQETSRLLHLLN